MFTNEPFYQLGEQAPLVVPDELLNAGVTIADIIERSGLKETTTRTWIKQGYVPKGKPDREKRLRDAIDKFCEEYGIAYDSYGRHHIDAQMDDVQYLATESIERIIDLLDTDDLERLEGIAWALYKKEYPTDVKFYYSRTPSPATNNKEWHEMTDEEQAATTAEWQRAIDDARNLINRHREAEAYHNAVEAAANDAPLDMHDAQKMFGAHPRGTTWRGWLKANDDARKLLEHNRHEQLISIWLDRWPADQRDTYEYEQLLRDLAAEMQAEEAERQRWLTDEEREAEHIGPPLKHLIDES